jgi:hypothetical protein
MKRIASSYAASSLRRASAQAGKREYKLPILVGQVMDACPHPRRHVVLGYLPPAASAVSVDSFRSAFAWCSASFTFFVTVLELRSGRNA